MSYNKSHCPLSPHSLIRYRPAIVVSFLNLLLSRPDSGGCPIQCPAGVWPLGTNAMGSCREKNGFERVTQCISTKMPFGNCYLGVVVYGTFEILLNEFLLDTTKLQVFVVYEYGRFHILCFIDSPLNLLGRRVQRPTGMPGDPKTPFTHESVRIASSVHRYRKLHPFPPNYRLARHRGNGMISNWPST